MSLFVYLLAGQLSQLEFRLASGLDVSLGQGVQSLGSSFPVLAEKVPGELDPKKYFLDEVKL